MSSISKHSGRSKRSKVTGQNKKSYGRGREISAAKEYDSYINKLARTITKPISEIQIINDYNKYNKKQKVIAKRPAVLLANAQNIIANAFSYGRQGGFAPFRAVIIKEYGDWDENPETARTSHLDPVISFIKNLGYKPLANGFIFDKSGFGQYVFNSAPSRYLMARATQRGDFPVEAFIESMKQNKKSILLKAIVLVLRQRFEFPASIEVGDNGFVYDNGNAIQIGFSNLPEHPMLRKQK